jgi:hypothetical protein
MSAESDELTAMLPKATKIVYLNAFQRPQIGLLGMGTWIIQRLAKMTARQTMNAGLNWTMIVMIQINRNSSL